MVIEDWIELVNRIFLKSYSFFQSEEIFIQLYD